MKRVSTTLFAICAFLVSFSQETSNTVLTYSHVEQFYKTKTYVVMDDNPMSDYNAKIEDAVKKYWKVTPFQFVSQQEFQLKRTDPNCSFLILSVVTFAIDNLQARYDFFSLLLGGNYAVMNQMPVLGAVPIGYTEAPQESSMYKLGAILKFLQKHIERLKADPELVKTDLYKLYNKDQKTIKDKTLYLVREEMTPEFRSESKIKSIYPDKFKFVSREELEEAIDKDLPGIVFLHKVGPEGTKKKARCYKVIIGTDSQLYYFDWHMITDSKPDGLLESDFKKILKFKNE